MTSQIRIELGERIRVRTAARRVVDGIGETEFYATSTDSETLFPGLEQEHKDIGVTQVIVLNVNGRFALDRQEWKNEVSRDDTSLGYREWVHHRAKDIGYAGVEAPFWLMLFEDGQVLTGKEGSSPSSARR